jgi:predicted Na+-dependent transporter
VDTLINIATLVFVVSSMLAMGLGLTPTAILGPLRSPLFVLTALGVNFVVVPLLAVGIQAVFDLDDPLYGGLLLIATAAGAPFLPKLAELARADAARAVGLMVLLMTTTVLYMPVVLPMLLPEVTIHPWDIASSLLLLMLLPLAVGLLVRARARRISEKCQPIAARTSTIAIAVLVVVGLAAKWSNVVDLFGTGGLAAIAVFLTGALAAGFLAGGTDSTARSLSGLGDAQRNLSAALVVAAQNFSDTPDTLTFVIVAALVGLVALILTASLFGRRNRPAPSTDSQGA